MEWDLSHDSFEIEAKFRITSFKEIKKLFQLSGVTCSGIEVQRDVYYASPDRDFGCSDEALRIRYVEQRTVLTYKGPKLASIGMKAREEINVRVEAGKDLEIILQRLGFSAAYTVEKKRERYEWRGAEISLDEVKGLGTFVEIELKEPCKQPEEKIETIKKELGLVGDHISLSYLELLCFRETEDQSGYPSHLR